MSAPVRHTCPKIDDVISSIRLVRAWAYSNSKVNDIDSADAIEDFKSIESELSGLEYILEDLRSDNDDLRTWGHDLEKEIEEKDSIINDLENQISELDSAIGNANL